MRKVLTFVVGEIWKEEDTCEWVLMYTTGHTSSLHLPRMLPREVVDARSLAVLVGTLSSMG